MYFVTLLYILITLCTAQTDHLISTGSTFVCPTGCTARDTNCVCTGNDLSIHTDLSLTLKGYIKNANITSGSEITVIDGVIVGSTINGRSMKIYNPLVLNDVHIHLDMCLTANATVEIKDDHFTYFRYNCTEVPQIDIDGGAGGFCSGGYTVSKTSIAYATPVCAGPSGFLPLVVVCIALIVVVVAIVVLIVVLKKDKVEKA